MNNGNYIQNVKDSAFSCIFKNSGRRLGAYFLDNGSAVFRLFTFSGIKNAALEIKPKNKPVQKLDMIQESECIWYLQLDNGIVSHGDRYRFIIERGHEIYSVKDPCSMYQDYYFKWSRLYNHSLFKWTDEKWMKGHDPLKISRIADETNGLLDTGALRIYEMHIGTLTEEGTFSAAKLRLKEIADMQFNTVEIMPVENTYSFNWGYDGADKYAPNHTYGAPDDLKELINYAHELGLNVIMDFVPNHLGPDIAELQNTGPYTDGVNPFGYKFNYEGGKYSEYVRDFITGAALNWALNYHCDGLRFDMTKFMCSDFTMKQLAAELNFHAPDVFLIAEDGRENDSRVTNKFTYSECEENELKHDKFIGKIKNNNISLSNLGYDTEWDFPFHKQAAASVLGMWDGREKNLRNFDYSLRAAQTRVKYIMSHDEIGNIDGTRLISKILARETGLEGCVLADSREKACVLAAHAAHRLSAAFISGQYENFSSEERKNFCEKNNLTICPLPHAVFEAYKKAVRKHKLILGKMYSIPGPKMVFQGDEEACLSYFKFFRKFSTGPEPQLRNKGYEPGLEAFLDSKLNAVKVSEKYAYINDAVRSYTKDLNILCAKNPALASGHIENTIVHEHSDIHAVYAGKIYSGIFSVSNFSNVSYLNNYGIMFPKGKWREILNSDDKKYAGEGKHLNTGSIKEQFSYISLAPFGIAFFERI